jgi:hypothetical protein
MEPTDKYSRIFGRITHLRDAMPWTTGVSSMAEYLLWHTQAILGVSKTQLIRDVVRIAHMHKNDDIDTALHRVDGELQLALQKNQADERYADIRKGYMTPREALRRLKFFSEDYLNKEFDIFMSLASDAYINALYARYTKHSFTGPWSTHGNGGIFATSTGLRKMQMDNIAYSEQDRVLVSHELKLGAEKNKDQILKYAYMQCHLVQRGYIEKDTQHILLFIQPEKETKTFDLQQALRDEIAFCQKKDREYLVTDTVRATANRIDVYLLSWHDVISHNIAYMETLTPMQQTEKKLLEGFTASLQEKYLLQEK